jgi:hypothetical protein
MAMNKLITKTLLLGAGLMLLSSAHAQKDEVKRYITPSANPENVYFGDAHVHTAMSMDAAAWGASQMPEGAHRYARGEEVTSFKGWKTQLTRPLDWLVIADHSDGYDFYNRVKGGDPWIVKEELGKRWHELLQKGGEAERRIVADEIIKGFGGGRRYALERGRPSDAGPRLEANDRGSREVQRPGTVHCIHWLRVELSTRG